MRLTVQDFNAKGLLGSLHSRTSDFWNYWLNFGLSNKDASLRGGRGIGRVTFLIASQIRAVIGITRRYNDESVASCGMGVLKAGEYGGDFKSTHGYLAESENGSIYALHGGDQFHRDLEELFALESFTGDAELTGLALIMPGSSPPLAGGMKERGDYIEALLDSFCSKHDLADQLLRSFPQFRSVQ